MVDRADEEDEAEAEAEDVDADGSVAGLTTWRRPPRGRPSLSGRGGPSPRLLVRLPAELHAQVVRAAVQQQLSVARWTRRAVEDALTRQQDAPFLRRRTRWSVRPLPYETGRMLVVVLAGGASSRMGGGDKTRTRLGGRALLDHVLGWLPEETCVVVGDKRPLAVGREVHWCRERPPGSGPVAAVRAALDAAWDRTLPVLRWSDDEVLLLAGDAPFAPRAAARLRVALAADRHADVAMLVDDHGRRQHLCAVWRWSSLKAAVSDSSRRSMRSLLEGRQVVEVPARHGEAQDCDEAADLAVLDAILRGT